MYRVLIADDEHWIRKWITKMITELRSDFEIIASVDNGIQVLEILKNQEVDIIISDIMMPELNGLDLVEKLRDMTLIAPQIIFVSGHEDFAFAQKALRLGAVEYLLKPIEKNELANAFQLAVARIEEQNGNVKMISQEQKYEFPYARVYYFLEKYLKQKEDEISKHMLENLEKLLGNDYIYYLGVCMFNILKNEKNISAFELEQILRDKYPKYHVYVMQREFSSFYIMLIAYKEENVAELSASHISYIVKQQSQVSKVNFSESQISIKSLGNIRSALDNNFAEKKSAYSAGEKIATSRQFNAIRANLLLAVTTANFNEVNKIMAQLRQMDKNKQGTYQDFKDFFFICISELVKKVGVGSSEEGAILCKQAYDFIANTQNYYDIEAMIEWMEEYLSRVIKFIGKSQYYNVNDIVAQVLQYLLSNYHEDINLSTICDSYNINVSYFSKKFKEHTGMNFIDMLTAIRIDAAKQMLENSNKPIFTVSSEAGFRDAKYFSKVFQTKVGMRPSEYRNSVAGEVL